MTTRQTSVLKHGDTPAMQEAINELEDRGFKIRRTSPHQLKYRDTNFYPDTGTITIDPQQRYDGQGLHTYLDLLAERHPLTIKI